MDVLAAAMFAGTGWSTAAATVLSRPVAAAFTASTSSMNSDSAVIDTFFTAALTVASDVSTAEMVALVRYDWLICETAAASESTDLQKSEGWVPPELQPTRTAAAPVAPMTREHRRRRAFDMPPCHRTPDPSASPGTDETWVRVLRIARVTGRHTA